MTQQEMLQNQQNMFGMGQPQWLDDFSMSTKDENALYEACADMEKNSAWHGGIESSLIRVEKTVCTDINDAKGIENVSNSTGLTLLVDGRRHYVSELARHTLYDTAKISGMALGRLSVDALANVLNECFRIAKGETLMLVRYDKVMALHGGKYEIIPITNLLSISEDLIFGKYGKTTFVNGFHSNWYSEAIWSLDDMQASFATAYKKALEGSMASEKARELVPALKFAASDTGQKKVTLAPLALTPNGEYISFMNGIAVKHERRDGKTGEQQFVDRFDDLYAKFDENLALITKLANTEVWHPVNAFIGLCNSLNRSAVQIKRKYADAARAEIEYLSDNGENCISAYDIFLAMTECTRAAKADNASQRVINNINEAIARVPRMNFSTFDVGGTVAWGK